MKINKHVLTLLFSFLLYNGFSQNLPITKIWGMSIKDERASTSLEVNNNTFFVSSFRFNNNAILNMESILVVHH